MNIVNKTTNFPLVGYDSQEYLEWSDLTDTEKAQAREAYMCIRENEEGRGRYDTISNADYNEPINGEFVKYCLFKKTDDGCIVVYC